MSAAAVIVSYRTGPALKKCLASLANARGLDEIILVDNGNAPDEARLLDAFAAADHRVRLLRGQGNVGFAAACNLGAHHVQSEVVLFINPDVVLEADAVQRMAEAIAASPLPTLIGGDLRDSTGAPERGGRRERLTLWRAAVSLSGMSRFERLTPVLRDYDRRRDPLPERASPVGAVSGALMAMRSADFHALGGFDEGYFLHVEDLDFSRRAEEAGWSVVFQPGPHGTHLRSTSAVEAHAVARHKAFGAARYFRKFARGPLERAAAGIAGAALEASALLLHRRRSGRITG